MKLSPDHNELRLCVETAFVDLFIASNLDLIFNIKDVQINLYNRYRDKVYQYFVQHDNILRVYFNTDDHTWLCEKSPFQFSKSGKGFVDLYCLLNNTEPKYVISHIKLKIKSKKIYQKVNILKSAPSYLELGFKIRSLLLPNLIHYRSHVYNKLAEYDYIVNDRRCGVVVKYGNNSDYFEVLLEPYYAFDSYKFNDAYYFLNFDWRYDFVSNNSNLYSNHHPKIIIFEDFALSVKFNKIILDSHRFNYSDYVAISFLYVSKNVVDDFCDNFQSCEVFYVPNGERESFMNFGLFHKISEKIKEFKIFKENVFLHDGTSVKNSNLIENNKFDKYLNDSYLLVDNCKSDILIDIATKSLDYKQYSQWCMLFGLKNAEDRNDERSSTLFIDLKMDHLVNYQSNPLLCSIFSHGSISFFYGKPKIGKSLFVTSLFYYLTMNFCPFHFDVQSNRRVLLIDFKNNKNDFLANLKSIHAPYFQNMPSSTDFFASLIKEISPDFICDFTDVDFQKYVEAAILNSKCDIVLFDSIYLKSSSWAKFTSNWKNVNDWLVKIQNKYSVAIVFIFDHVSDLSFYQDLYYDAHNVIHISSPLSISGEEGVQIQCKFESVRSTPGLNGKKYCYSKPSFDDINISKWSIVDIDLEANSKPNNLEANLSNYEKVFIFIQNNPNFTREDIDKLLCRSPSLSQKIIQRIVKDGKARKINTTKKASYQFTG
jgi:hypothetical protein